jgi:hypothetical protein
VAADDAASNKILKVCTKKFDVILLGDYPESLVRVLRCGSY